MRLDRLMKGDPIDVWLARQSLWKKPVPTDKDALYRAASENLFMCQNFYPFVKEKCERFLEKSLDCESMGFTVDGKDEGKNKQACLKALAHAFECNVMLFKNIGSPPKNVARTQYDRKLMLFLTEDGFFEAVLPLSSLSSSAVCQSIVYEILYNRVFHFKKSTIDYGVAMIRNKSNPKSKRVLPLLSPQDYANLPKDVPPFPFRSAKSLDPEMFRNAQYDLWLDDEKALAAQQPKVGDYVLVRLKDDIFHGHVQSVESQQGPFEVYIEELCERFALPYSSVTIIPRPKPARMDTKPFQGMLPGPAGEVHTGIGGYNHGVTGANTGVGGCNPGYGVGITTEPGGINSGLGGVNPGYRMGISTGPGGINSGFNTGYGVGVSTGPVGINTGLGGVAPGYGGGINSGLGGVASGYGVGITTGPGGINTGLGGINPGYSGINAGFGSGYPATGGEICAEPIVDDVETMIGQYGRRPAVPYSCHALPNNSPPEMSSSALQTTEVSKFAGGFGDYYGMSYVPMSVSSSYPSGPQPHVIGGSQQQPCLYHQYSGAHALNSSGDSGQSSEPSCGCMEPYVSAPMPAAPMQPLVQPTTCVPVPMAMSTPYHIPVPQQHMGVQQPCSYLCNGGSGENCQIPAVYRTEIPQSCGAFHYGPQMNANVPQPTCCHIRW